MPAVNTAGVSKQKIKNTNRGQDNKNTGLSVSVMKKTGAF